LSEWTVHGSRTICTSPWVELDLVDVEPPGHARYEHHLVTWAPVAATVLLNDRDEVLPQLPCRVTVACVGDLVGGKPGEGGFGDPHSSEGVIAPAQSREGSGFQSGGPGCGGARRVACDHAGALSELGSGEGTAKVERDDGLAGEEPRARGPVASLVGGELCGALPAPCLAVLAEGDQGHACGRGKLRGDSAQP